MCVDGGLALRVLCLIHSCRSSGRAVVTIILVSGVEQLVTTTKIAFDQVSLKLFRHHPAFTTLVNTDPMMIPIRLKPTTRISMISALSLTTQALDVALCKCRPATATALLSLTQDKCSFGELLG